MESVAYQAGRVRGAAPCSTPGLQHLGPSYWGWLQVDKVQVPPSNWQGPGALQHSCPLTPSR